jgi:hypothetical protein
MCANDGLHRKLVPAEQVQNAAYFIAGIYDQGLARRGVGNDRAVALQHPHRDGDLKETVLFRACCWRQFWSEFGHRPQYNLAAQSRKVAEE